MSDSFPVSSGPIDPSKRIEAIDMVRGFALFGVLLVNMYNFGASSIIWTAPVDQVSYSVMHFFFETKSWRLFSFLFGLGFTLQMLRARSRSGPFLPVYLRRLFILFIFGMAHTLIYDGDILMPYAELGLVLIIFRKIPLRIVLVLIIALLAVCPIGNFVKSITSDNTLNAKSTEIEIAEAKARNEKRLRTHPYAVGTVKDVFMKNAESLPPRPLKYPLDAESDLGYFAMFLLGLYVGRREIFHNIEGHLSLIRSVFKWGMTFGIISMITERILAFGWGYNVWGERGLNIAVEFFGDTFFVYGSTALSMGYAAGIVLLSRTVRKRRLVKPFGPVGRMALTVYITQSLAFTTLFYGYGFGQVGRLGPAGVTAWAVFIFVCQVIVCAWWVKRFRFGPLEWLWRGLTYLKFPSNRLQSFIGNRAQESVE
jgi:uncharacterized protein